ncbi:hypothetical protein ACFJYX_12465 [Enterococcus faecalis]|uniref:hypothetical protein n=1 Tax=Enterococcus TaxID=1350 RepID=UPI0015731667|nr:hypothetical protein [Enterococcus faecalis]EGO8595541.1 hypothetical protein [Enterococcus faecalis]EKR9303774.1 hypothetical protein [Enterococcus faecalis]NSQ64968.1 hypothetical protein [Enterococcus faecalis]
MKKPKGFWLLTAGLFGAFFIFGLAINLWPTDKKDVEKEEYILSSTTDVSSESEETTSFSTVMSKTKNSVNKEQPSRNSIDKANWNEANLDSITKLEAIGTQFIVSLMDPDVKKDSSIKTIVNDSVYKKLVGGQYPSFQLVQNIEKEEVIHYGSKEQLIYSFMGVDKHNRGLSMTCKILFEQTEKEWKIEEVSFQEKE